jgi:hypothetical protein
VSYYPEISTEWAQRWVDVHQGVWLVGPQDFQDLADRHIDYLVLRAEHAIPGKLAEFGNSHYVVYQVVARF